MLGRLGEEIDLGFEGKRSGEVVAQVRELVQNPILRLQHLSC